MDTVPGTASVFDRLLAGELNKHQLAGIILQEVYSKAVQFCDIPGAYHHCQLAFRTVDMTDWDEAKLRLFASIKHPDIINPDKDQLLAIKFFQLLVRGDALVCERNDPFSPRYGAYLYGRPGTGKTHIMASAALALKAILDKRLIEVRVAISNSVDKLYELGLDVSGKFREKQKGIGRYTFSDDGKITESGSLEPSVWFDQQIEGLKRKVATFRWSPTDILYLSFDQLREQASDPAVLSALESAKLLFLDDVDQKGSKNEGIEVFQELLQRRYELGRPGVIVSTNLTAKELGGKNSKMRARLSSRTAAMLYKICFKSKDWRVSMHAKLLGALNASVIGLLKSEDGIDVDSLVPNPPEAESGPPPPAE